MEEKEISEQESLRIIQQMIDKARNSIIDKGIWPIYWGALITFCSLVLFIEIRLQKFLPFEIFFITLPALAVQIAIIVYQRRKSKGKPKAAGQCEKAISLVWIAFTVAIMLVSFVPGGSNPVVFFVLYGMPTFVTGALVDFKPMAIGGILCWLCALAVLVFKISPATDLLLVALCATSAWLIPGIIMRRRYLRWKKKGNV
ncbi:MAG: hypothetical protein QM610_14120 [Chitinophagaceae bacterium]